jgi:hypothetical protein
MSAPFAMVPPTRSGHTGQRLRTAAGSAKLGVNARTLVSSSTLRGPVNGGDPDVSHSLSSLRLAWGNLGRCEMPRLIPQQSRAS